MISFGITGTFTPDFLQRVQSWANADPFKLAEQIKKIVVEGNRTGLLAGTNADGGPMADLAESTIRRGRGGFGPPTIPRFSGSRFIDRFEANVRPIGVRGYRIEAGWRDAETSNIAGILSRGFAPHNLPPRPLRGVRPADQEKIRFAVREYAEELLKGNG